MIDFGLELNLELHEFQGRGNHIRTWHGTAERLLRLHLQSEIVAIADTTPAALLGTLLGGRIRTSRQLDHSRQHILGELLVSLHVAIVLFDLTLSNLLDECLGLRIDFGQLRPASRNDSGELEESDLAMLLAMLALLSLAGPGVPIRQEPDALVALGNVVKVYLVVEAGLVW